MDTAEMRRVGAAEPPAESAAERVYRHVKSQILARHYPPHELLTEGDLAAVVGVSRTPVREALLRLEADGLVRLLPKRGALVMPVTPEETADVLETRRLVETYAVRKAATSGSAELVARLTTHLQAMQDAARRRDSLAYVVADRDFHDEIVAATGNAIIVGLYRSLRDRQLRMGMVNLLDDSQSAVDPARMRSMIGEHRRILDAIAAHTIRAAEHAVASHLDHAERVLGRR